MSKCELKVQPPVCPGSLLSCGVCGCRVELTGGGGGGSGSGNGSGSGSGGSVSPSPSSRVGSSLSFVTAGQTGCGSACEGASPTVWINKDIQIISGGPQIKDMLLLFMLRFIF